MATIQIQSCPSVSTSRVSSSVQQYIDYSRKMQTRLAEINNNVSSVIQESVTGIDSICNKVRDCLNDMEISHRDKSAYLTDEVTEFEIEDENSMSDEELYKTCKEMPEVVNKNAEDISVIERVDTDTELSIQDEPALAPFFTVIDPESMKRKQVLHKIYSANKREPFDESDKNSTNLEEFKETVSTLCNNFEIMNKLVESINEEITKFSQTALDEEKSEESVITNTEGRKSPTRNVSRSKPSASKLKNLPVTDSSSSITVVDFTELNKDGELLILPDVYRKRAFTNLYGRLIAQIEANDSLVFFQHLMEREKKISQIKLNIPAVHYPEPDENVSQNQVKTSEKSTNKKFAGSLWFSPQQVKSGRKGPKRATPDKKKSRTPESKSRSNDTTKSVPQANKTRRLYDLRTCPIGCTCRTVVENNMPASPSIKCHLQWLRAKAAYAPQRKLDFLDILDDLTAKDLLPLKSEYPRRDHVGPRELSYKEIQDTYLYKLMYGKQSTRDAWKQLLDSSLACVHKNCSVCKTPPRSSHSKRIKEEKSGESFMDKFCKQNYSKTDVLRTLTPYIYDVEKPGPNPNQTFIVMPLRVYYDNAKLNEPPTKLKNSRKTSPKVNVQSSSNEVKLSKRIEPSTSRPLKVVYDGLPKTMEPVPSTTKPVIHSARLSIEKTPISKVISRSFSPRRFAPYCHELKPVKKSLLEERHQQNVSIHNKIQADIEKIKREIYGSKETNIDRKLWSNKYKKTVGQQLVSFVQKQEPEMVRPVPRYALPKLRVQAAVPEKGPASRPVKTMKQMPVYGKDKNEAVQNTIKKTIDVIESQMVDILCDDCNSIEAFNIMEKEITNVLNLMKCNRRKAYDTASKISAKDSRKEPVTNRNKDTSESLEEDYNIISDQLFERLQRILDTGGSSAPSTPTEDSVVRKPPKKEEVKRKQKFSGLRRKKINILSPSTSASNEVVAKRQSKPNPKRVVEENELRSATMPVILPLQSFDNVYYDQNIAKYTEGEIDTKKCDDQEQIVSKDCNDLENSRGDFVKQEKTDTLLYDEVTDQLVDNASNDNPIDLVPIEEPVHVPDPVQNAEELEIINTPEITKFIRDEVEKVIDSIGTVRSENIEQVTSPEVENDSSNYDSVSSDVAEKYSKAEDNVEKKEDGGGNFSEQVHKIIKRVEDIYLQLDDIQDSDSVDNVPVFKETDLSEVHSEIFLTPFMHAVTETRKNVNDPNTMALIEKSASFYNVMTFLDSLNDIHTEVANEIHRAHVYCYPRVCYEPTVYNQSETWYQAEYSSVSAYEKPSCLKKSEDTKQIKQKKVSFLDLDTEDKSSQVTLCPYHKVKIIRISSQQFPPLEKSSGEEIYEKFKSCQVKSKPAEQLCDKNVGQSPPLTIDTYTNQDSRNIDCPTVSKIDDKSTQVFCQMQKQEKSTDPSSVSSYEEHSIDCPEHVEENPDDSRSTDKDILDDSLLDPFYDYTNDSVTTKRVKQKIEVYEEDGTNYSPQQPNVVIFREIDKQLKQKKNFNIALYKERLEKRKEIRLQRRLSAESIKRTDTENVLLLKSFYAILYILMFTALSLDYTCL